MTEPKWHQDLTSYQWRVLLCACLGWALDIMDGYLYAIILFPAMSDLLGTTESAVIGLYGGIVLSIFMIGWALGGLIFGPIADRYGRAKTMAITILIYASFTGLCGIAGSWQELALYRFLTGIGIGGEWAAGAALIAETWPAKSRAKAAGIMQASGGIGFFLATALYLFIGPYGWRWVFALGVLPALVAFYIRRSLEEPQRWTRAKTQENPLPLLFKKPVRRDVMIGTGLAVVATFGYQGAIQWVPSWIAAMLHAQGTSAVIPQVSLVTTTLTTGGIIGCLCLPYRRRPLGQKTRVVHLFSRRPAFRADDFLARARIEPRGHRSADHGIFRRRRHHGFRDLLSRIVSHGDPCHGPRLLFQLCAFLFCCRAAARRCAHFGARLLCPGDRYHWLGLLYRFDHSDLRPRNPWASAAGLEMEKVGVME